MRPSFITAALSAAVLLGAATSSALAAPILFGPTPYTSSADTPAGFYGGGPSVIETFEDFSLDFGITASAGSVLGPGAFTDSVDIDDGVLDGSGLGGHSWWYPSGSIGVTFTLPGLPTAAGLVWTDGNGTTTFEAFGPGMVSLGTTTPVVLQLGGAEGRTDEDHFFGVQDPNGILAIKISNTSTGIEIDHVQFSTVPEPGTLPLMALGLVGVAGLLRRREQRRLAGVLNHSSS